MYVTDFEYANRRLSDYGCIVCYIRTTPSEEIDIGCDITFNTIRNNCTYIHSKTSSTYENVYSATFDIMKNPCLYEDIYFSSNEIRELVKWLNRHDYYKFKLLNNDDNEYLDDVCYYGSFNVREIVIGGNIIGLTLTFTSNAPYGFGETKLMEFEINNADDRFYIYGESDEYGLIYPKLEITCLSDGDLTIRNYSTNNILSVKKCVYDETLLIDGTHKIISTDTESHTTFYNDFNYSYLDILNEEYSNENMYVVSMPCKIKVSYMPVRKVGVI